MGTGISAHGRELWWFFVALALLSVPFYVVGPLLGSLPGMPVELPGAALMFVVPTLAALIVAARPRVDWSLRSALRRQPCPTWVWAVALVVVPMIVAASSGGLDTPNEAIAQVGVLIVAYLIAALLEEIGWTGFVLQRLLPLIGELGAGALIGAVWALWHIIPLVQRGDSLSLILAQSAFSVAFRMLLVRLTVASRGTIWPAVIGHAAFNVAWSLSPDSGTLYNPWVAAGLTILIWSALYMMRITTKPSLPTGS